MTGIVYHHNQTWQHQTPPGCKLQSRWKEPWQRSLSIGTTIKVWPGMSLSQASRTWENTINPKERPTWKKWWRSKSSTCQMKEQSPRNRFSCHKRRSTFHKRRQRRITTQYHNQTSSKLLRRSRSNPNRWTLNSPSQHLRSKLSNRRLFRVIISKLRSLKDWSVGQAPLLVSRRKKKGKGIARWSKS